MTIWCMRVTCWIIRATHSLTVCNTYCFSTATMVCKTGPECNVYTYIACIVVAELNTLRTGDADLRF